MNINWLLDYIPSSNDPLPLNTNFIIGVLSSIVATIITYIATVFFRFRIPGLNSLFFWWPLSKRLYIIPSEFWDERDPYTRGGRHFVMVPLGEALALADLLNRFRVSFKASPKVVSVQSQQDFDLVKAENLILIGGPKYNLASKFFLTDIDSTLKFQFKRIVAENIVDQLNINLKQFISRDSRFPNYSLASDGGHQYATVIIMRNPYNRNNFIVCLGGLNQMSTLAASRWITCLKGFVLLKALWRGSGLQAIIECDVTDNVSVTNIEAIATVTLK